MERQPTLPTFGEIVPGEGGRLGAILRGALIDGVRQPDYAVIVPDADASEIASIQWGPYGDAAPGAGSITDGWSNTLAMAQAGCESAKRVRAMSVDGHQDLYIPSRGELWALRANVPELFAKEWYWSSTQYSRSNAFAQVFEYGTSYWRHKGNEFRVRAVRRIPLQHFPA